MEAANDTTPDADKIINEKTSSLFPTLANAEALPAAILQVQSNQLLLGKDEVLAKLNIKMTSAFKAVYELAQQNLRMRDLPRNCY